MKVLFASFRYDPSDPDAGSGADHGFYTAFKEQGIEPHIIGPFPDRVAVWERLVSKLHKIITPLSYAKFRVSSTHHLSAKLNEAVARHRPDVVFTMWPNFLAFYAGKRPTVYRLDTCLYGQQMEWPTYSRLAMKITEWEEQKAFANAALVITHSDWSKQVIAGRYGVAEGRIEVFPVPSSLPSHVIPRAIDVRKEKHLDSPVRLLLVGRVYERKGVDTAIEIADALNRAGVSAVLTVVGLKSRSENLNVRFAGPYKKSDPVELQQYVEHYRQAHLLLHPARFEAAGMAPSEAAAFATPTITNDVGGLGTTVADGISGIVLPKGSSAALYADRIIDLVRDPERYYALCQTTRQRYDRELNWDVAGKRLIAAVQRAVQEFGGVTG